MERDDYEVDYEMDYGAAAATGGDLTDHAPPPDSHHTQFLDLTNGEGGERHAFDSDHEQLQPVEGQEAHYEEDDEEEDLAAAADDGGYHPRPSLPSNAHANPNPNTPGKVVEAGHEHTGRWTKEEHEDFLEALQLHGKEWKKVAAKVKTRTVVQTRTHAQKYFQKLQKVQEETPGGVDVDQVDMGINADSKKPPSAKKQRPIAPKPSRRSSSTTLSAAQVMANFSSQRDVVPIFAMGSTPVAAHGFGPLTDMKITAPDPMSSMAKGKFPEPSPAATGKRKLAEIAAARMLAGVAGVSLLSREDAPTPPPSEDLAGPPPPPLLMSSAHPARKGLSLQIVNPDSLGISFEKRRRTGETSPVTPWDGQMEALLNEKAKASTTAKPSPMGSTTSESPHPTPATTLHPVCGPSDAYGRSPLHQAVCSMDIESLQDLLEAVGHTLSQWDEAGYAPLHTACALRMNHPDHAVAAMELAKLLLKAGADANVLDQQGNSALHWAARAGDREVAEMLLLKNVPLDGRNQDGESPLHWGMRAGLAAADAVGLLLDNGARAAALSKSFRRPVDVGAEGFLDEETSVVALRARDSRSQHKKLSKELKAALKGKNMEMRESRKLFLSNSAHSRTLVLHHPECLEHVPKSKSDWEAPDRVVTILEQLAAGMEANAVRPMVYNHEVAISTDFERAKLDLLSRVHGAEYLSFVHDLSKDLERKVKGAREDSDDSPAPVVPFTPMVQRSMIKIKEAEVKLHSNSDTAFSAGSLKAARRAAGAVQHAVDWYV
jgi:SHAQKYF class myb-like DNA-binding protein